MNKNEIQNIGILLGQFGGPISATYSLKKRANISLNLIEYHKNKYLNIDSYNPSDYYSLAHIIEFVVNDLGEEDFNLITGLDLYKDGYPLINRIKSLI